MNDDEIRVKNFLQECGYHDVTCWPDGPNAPPDFLIGGSIAIEVRRLNQNHVTNVGTRGLGEVSKQLIDSIEKIALSLRPPNHGRSWFIFVDFRRPVGDYKLLRGLIRVKLQDFMAGKTHEKSTFKISNRVSIEISPASKLHETFYVIGGFIDHDASGWVIPEMTKNIAICVDEKTRKIARVRDKYPHWWLILVDYISPGLDDDDRHQIREHLAPIPDWDKVIILNRGDGTRSFTI